MLREDVSSENKGKQANKGEKGKNKKQDKTTRTKQEKMEKEKENCFCRDSNLCSKQHLHMRSTLTTGPH